METNKVYKVETLYGQEYKEEFKSREEAEAFIQANNIQQSIVTCQVR